MRRGEERRATTGVAQDAGRHGGDRSLALAPRDVDRGKTGLRVAELCQEGLDHLESRPRPEPAKLEEVAEGLLVGPHRTNALKAGGGPQVDNPHEGGGRGPRSVHRPLSEGPEDLLERADDLAEGRLSSQTIEHGRHGVLVLGPGHGLQSTEGLGVAFRIPSGAQSLQACRLGAPSGFRDPETRDPYGRVVRVGVHPHDAFRPGVDGALVSEGGLLDPRVGRSPVRSRVPPRPVRRSGRSTSWPPPPSGP